MTGYSYLSPKACNANLTHLLLLDFKILLAYSGKQLRFSSPPPFPPIHEHIDTQQSAERNSSYVYIALTEGPAINTPKTTKPQMPGPHAP